MNIRKFSLILGLMGVFFFNVNCADAKTQTTDSNAPNTAIHYSVNKVPNGKEPDPGKSYFDLLVKPGDTVDLEANIFNAEAKDIMVQQAAYTSFTNKNGEISYATKLKDNRFDKSLKIKFSDIAKPAAIEAQRIPAEGKTLAKMTLKIPKDASNGVILGSWYFEKDKQNDQSADSGISIKNKYSYAIGVKITVGTEISKPNLNLLSVKAEMNNYHKVIDACIQNDQPAIVSNLTFDATVTRKGSGKVLYKNNKGTVIMAPNSDFDYPLYLGNQLFKSGKYTLHLKAHTNDPKWKEETWKWDKDFIITSEKAQKINNKAINDGKPPVSIWWYVACGLVVLILIVLLVVLLVSRRYKHEIAQLKKNKKEKK